MYVCILETGMIVDVGEEECTGSSDQESSELEEQEEFNFDEVCLGLHAALWRFVVYNTALKDVFILVVVHRMIAF